MNNPRVVCIDDKDRPDEIPPEKWLVKNRLYHISHVYKSVLQNELAVTLYEIELTEDNFPYESFLLRRFAILEDDWDMFWELAFACKELDDVNFDELVKPRKIEEYEYVKD